MGFMFAVLSGKAKPLPFTPPVQAGVSAHPDLTYLTVGNHELKLDLNVPKTTAKPAPLVVLIHGGCWMEGSAQKWAFMPSSLLSLVTWPHRWIIVSRRSHLTRLRSRIVGPQSSG